MQKKLEVAEALQAPNEEGQKLFLLHSDLLELKARVQQQEEALKEREKLLKMAAGKDFVFYYYRLEFSLI